MLEFPLPWLRTNIQKEFRIWSAGCSSGMEPYSIAMVLKETIKDIHNWDVKILATDIDTNMLQNGYKGFYRHEAGEKIPKEYSKYFNVTRDGYQMSDEIKKLIHFKRMNFIEDWPVKGPFDIVFCRNVVIYFKKETQEVYLKNLQMLWRRRLGFILVIQKTFIM